MATSFAANITKLRKERGLSQKEVALSLGVSQALLSHYEKGVRECGLEFVVRCADYFGVTTDYLLGRQTSKYGLRYNFDDPNTTNVITQSENFDMQTVMLCGNYLIERFSIVDDNLGDKLLWAFAINQYKVVIAGIRSGRIREEWFDVSTRANDILFQQLVDGVYRCLFESTCTRSPVPMYGGKLPSFMNRQIKDVETYIEKIALNFVSRGLSGIKGK